MKSVSRFFFNDRTFRPAVGWFAIILFLTASLTVAVGQEALELTPDDSEPAAAVKPKTADELAEGEKKIKELVQQLRGYLKRAKIAEFEYITGKFDESEDWHEAFQKAIAEGSQIRQELLDTVYPIILQSPRLNSEMQELSAIVMFLLFEDRQYERCYQVANRLKDNDSSEDLKSILMRTALFTNRFEIAISLRDQVASKIAKLPKLELSMLQSLPDLARIGAEEAKLRQADKVSDLPRVELVTSEGRLVIELYEDQYPETVGHFIYLVESGFYNNLVFHRVTKNFLPFSIAQTGQMSLKDMGNGQQGWFAHDIKYNVVDEIPRDGAVRRHLRGVVSLCIKEDKEKAKRIPNSAGSQFMIILVPSPALDGNQVAFGRVIEGLDVIDRFSANLTISEEDGKEKPIDNPKYSKIIEAKVLRKREHEYLPNKVK